MSESVCLSTESKRERAKLFWAGKREKEREREKGAVWGRKTGQARVVAKARELAGD